MFLCCLLIYVYGIIVFFSEVVFLLWLFEMLILVFICATSCVSAFTSCIGGALPGTRWLCALSLPQSLFSDSPAVTSVPCVNHNSSNTALPSGWDLDHSWCTDILSIGCWLFSWCDDETRWNSLTQLPSTCRPQSIFKPLFPYLFVLTCLSVFSVCSVCNCINNIR